jgi:hypothetical protein
MIIVITTREKNPKTGRIEIIVSHGVESGSLKNIVLPNETPASIGAVYDSDLGEYILKGSA